MGKIIVRAATLCGALPVDRAAVYINGELRGYTKKNGYSEAIAIEDDACSVTVSADCYENFVSETVRLYENVTLVFSAMLKGQTRSKKQEKT